MSSTGDLSHAFDHFASQLSPLHGTEPQQDVMIHERDEVEEMDVDSNNGDEISELEREIEELERKEAELKNELSEAQQKQKQLKQHVRTAKKRFSAPKRTKHRTHSPPQPSTTTARSASAPELSQEEKDRAIALELQHQINLEERSTRRILYGGGSPFEIHRQRSRSSGDAQQNDLLLRAFIQHLEDEENRENNEESSSDHPFAGLLGRRIRGFRAPRRSPLAAFLLGNRVGSGMNVDLDNMSYEEILELQERIGFVSNGASIEQITALPTAKYRARPEDDGDDGDTDKKKCCICLEHFEEGDEIRRLPCLHIFHSDEIDHWLRKKNKCPICRQSIDDDPALLADAAPSS